MNIALDVHAMNAVRQCPSGGAMSSTVQDEEVANDRIMLGLFESVERYGGQSQLHIASELGIALGLVNAYLKRC